MCLMSCNRALRFRWSFMLFVLPFEVGPAHFWAALYHPELSKSRCFNRQKAHSLNLDPNTSVIQVYITHYGY